MGVNYFVEHAANGSIPQGKKLVISDEYFQRVTQALVMRLRQHEESVAQEGDQLNFYYLTQIMNYLIS